MEIVCTPQAYRGFESHSLRQNKRSPKRASFILAERVGSHTCAISNAQGAQVCKANLMSRTKAIVWKEVNIKNKVRAGLEVVANDPTLSAKPRIRAHLASFLYDSDCGHLRFGKLPCPHIRKNAICNPSSRFGGSVLSAKPRPKEPQTGSFFCGGESGITYLCIFKCTGCASLRKAQT